MNYLKLNVLMVAVLLSGCSASGWYEGMKARHQLECQNQPASEYEDCMKQTDKTYHDYEADRQVIEKGQ